MVIAPTSFASQGQFSVNGQRTNANYFIIDGVSANFGIAAGVNPGQSAGGSLPALTAFGGTNSLVSTDDVQEFAVLTSSYSAQFGRMPGGQISVVTRSGTNELHGTIFEYLRNDAFDANDWFANRDNLGRAALRQNDYGALLGGPLLRDTTFFFFSYEGLRLRQPSSEETDVPSLAVRSSAPTSLQPILNAYPLPNGPEEGTSGLASATYGFSNPSGLDTGSVRVDHHLHEFLSLFARYDQSLSDHQERGAAADSLSTVTDTRFGLKTFTVGLTYKSSPHWVNDFRFNWSESSATGRDHIDRFGGAISITPKDVLSPSVISENSLFQFVSALNAQHPELSVGQNVNNVQRQVNFVDSASFQSGSHLLQIGLDFRNLAPDITPASYQQQAVFSDMATVLTGKANIAIVVASVAVHSVFNNYSAFAQDTWKPSTRLSLTSGVRWEYNPASSAKGTNALTPAVVQNITDLPGLSLAPQGTPLFHSAVANFAPRFGLAYEVRNSSGAELIIRAGTGVFYDLANVAAGNAVGPGAFPFSAQSILFNVAFPLTPSNAEAPALTLSPPFSNIIALAPYLKLPYTWQWNVSVEQVLSHKQEVTVTYTGSLGQHLLRTEEFIGEQAGVSQNVGVLLFTNNAAYSNYNSFQVQFKRRFSAGPQILAQYTLSHSLDNASTDAVFNGIPGSFLDPHKDYGPSDFDIRHSATIGLNYQFPVAATWRALRPILSNWSADGIMMFRSAPPVDVVVSRNIGFGRYEFRPDLVNGAPLYLDGPDAPGGSVVNPGALSVPTTPRQGTLGRNFFRGFGFAQVDLAVQRHFHINNRFGVQTRIEAFNLLNRPNFAPPAGNFGSVDAAGTFFPLQGFGISQATLGRGLQGSAPATFGSAFSPLYQIGSARSLQLVLKMEF
jgi:hypothetical protein